MFEVIGYVYESVNMHYSTFGSAPCSNAVVYCRKVVWGEGEGVGRQAEREMIQSQHNCLILCQDDIWDI